MLRILFDISLKRIISKIQDNKLITVTQNVTHAPSKNLLDSSFPSFSVQSITKFCLLEVAFKSVPFFPIYTYCPSQILWGLLQ